jgi:hypothetical protein
MVYPLMLDVLATVCAGSILYYLVYQRDPLRSHAVCEGLERARETLRGASKVILVLRMLRLDRMLEPASDTAEARMLHTR